jgi:hypothetical protein
MKFDAKVYKWNILIYKDTAHIFQITDISYEGFEMNILIIVQKKFLVKF